MPYINYYRECFQKALRRLLRDPATGVVIVPNLLCRKYYDKASMILISEAMTVWSLFDFNSKLNSKLIHKTGHRYGKYEIMYPEIEKIKGELPSLIKVTKNPYIKAVCIIELLPTEVVRQWLWHYNVDFQSKENFLCRLTKEQMEALFNHYKLHHEDDVAIYDLPAFTEGWMNKLHKFFRLPYWFSKKMTPKSAIAFTFFGDMGFQLYPNKSNDTQADRRITKQLYLKRWIKNVLN